MDHELAEVIHHAHGAIREMEEWMLPRVRGFRGFGDDRGSHANLVGVYLREGRCDCGLYHCADQHNLAAQPASGLSLRAFVRRAVIGPGGLASGSIEQSMLYLHVLRPELNMQVAPVELKRCHNPDCGRIYEELRCFQDSCRTPFSPAETEVIGEDRLLIQGTYLPVRRWGCGGTHYYRQERCWEEVSVGPPPTYHVIHDPGGLHDYCLWQGCPHGNPRHAERGRGTTLWVRRELIGTAAPAPPLDPERAFELEALARAAERALQVLCPETRERVRAAMQQDPVVAPKHRDEPEVILDWLLSNARLVLTRSEMGRLRDELKQALRANGFTPEEDADGAETL
jgi:hypothetical protein